MSDTDSNNKPIRQRRRKGANGEGGVTKWRGRWIGRYTVYRPDGPKRRTVTADTKREAKAKLEEAVAARDTSVLSYSPKTKGDKFVYFIQGLKGGPIKIGIAKSVGKRFQSIQACSPVPLQVLHVIPNCDIGLEKELHERFAAYRLHGEWFKPNVQLTRYLRHLMKP